MNIFPPISPTPYFLPHEEEDAAPPEDPVVVPKNDVPPEMGDFPDRSSGGSYPSHRVTARLPAPIDTASNDRVASQGRMSDVMSVVRSSGMRPDAPASDMPPAVAAEDALPDPPIPPADPAGEATAPPKSGAAGDASATVTPAVHPQGSTQANERASEQTQQPGAASDNYSWITRLGELGARFGSARAPDHSVSSAMDAQTAADKAAEQARIKQWIAQKTRGEDVAFREKGLARQTAHDAAMEQEQRLNRNDANARNVADRGSRIEAARIGASKVPDTVAVRQWIDDHGGKDPMARAAPEPAPHKTMEMLKAESDATVKARLASAARSRTASGAGGAGGGGLSEDDVQWWAAQHVLHGLKPNLTRNSPDWARIAAAEPTWAKLNDVDPAEARAKSDALRGAYKAVQTGAAKTNAYEGAADGAMDILSKVSVKVPRVGFAPFDSALVKAAAMIPGERGENAKNMSNAAHTLATEYGRVMTGLNGVTTDQANARAEAMLSDGLSNGTMAAVMQQFRQEFKARNEGNEKELKRISDAIKAMFPAGQKSAGQAAPRRETRVLKSGERVTVEQQPNGSWAEVE